MPNVQVEPARLNKQGDSKGRLIGGNLSIICSLIGSSSFVASRSGENCILFLEDIDEYAYRLERMLYTLDRAGVLKKIKGLVVGQVTNVLENDLDFGKNADQLIYDVSHPYTRYYFHLFSNIFTGNDIGG